MTTIVDRRNALKVALSHCNPRPCRTAPTSNTRKLFRLIALATLIGGCAFWAGEYMLRSQARSPSGAFWMSGENWWTPNWCPDCGSRLFASAEKDPEVFNLRIGTVRQRASLAPKAQVWCRSALPWVMDLGSVKQHSKQPM